MKARKLCWRLRKRLSENFGTSSPVSHSVLCETSGASSVEIRNKWFEFFWYKWSNPNPIYHDASSWDVIIDMLVPNIDFLFYSYVWHIGKKWHTWPWMYRNHQLRLQFLYIVSSKCKICETDPTMERKDQSFLHFDLLGVSLDDCIIIHRLSIIVISSLSQAMYHESYHIRSNSAIPIPIQCPVSKWRMGVFQWCNIEKLI